MKNLVLLLVCTAASVVAGAQSLKQLTGKKNADTSRPGKVAGLLKGLTRQGSGAGSDEIVAALREALQKGAEQGSARLAATDGYFRNAAVKILLPAEAVKVETKLRGMGLGKQVDDLVLQMNRAAEDAAREAAPIFAKAITGMSIGDGLSILKSSDTAATQYLRKTSSGALQQAFQPVIENSLRKLKVSEYWDKLFSTYNRFSREKVQTDLSLYVTERALQGLFLQVAEEEKAIRKDPAARTTELLRKVFGS